MIIEFANYIYTPHKRDQIIEAPRSKLRGIIPRKVFCLIFNSLANPGRLRWTTGNTLAIAVQRVIFPEEMDRS